MVGSGQVQTWSASLDGEAEEAWALAVERLICSTIRSRLELLRTCLDQEYRTLERFFKVESEIPSLRAFRDGGNDGLIGPDGYVPVLMVLAGV